MVKENRKYSLSTVSRGNKNNEKKMKYLQREKILSTERLFLSLVHKDVRKKQ